MQMVTDDGRRVFEDGQKIIASTSRTMPNACGVICAAFPVATENNKGVRPMERQRLEHGAAKKLDNSGMFPAGPEVALDRHGRGGQVPSGDGEYFAR
jgi:hypothetical protein